MQSNSHPIRTRFAPSPTGYLHKGHALSALWSSARAKQFDGEFFVRIEDIDHTRCRSEMIVDIHRVLAWLELDVKHPIAAQQERRGLYEQAIKELHKLDVLYPCLCSRRDILAVTKDPAAPYPGTCRHKRSPVCKEAAAWRLDWQRLCQEESELSKLTWHDISEGQQNLNMAPWGDVLIVRRDIGNSYHLAHVVDDAEQQITHVTRGRDLFDQTSIHRVLQHLLRFPEPIYDHHPLLMRSELSNNKLSKRDGSTSLMKLVEQGLTRQSLVDELGSRLFPHFPFLRL